MASTRPTGPATGPMRSANSPDGRSWRSCRRELSFTASNIGTPPNPRLPYYAEQQPDARGYVANPAGSSFIDFGVGGFLARGHPLSQPSTVDVRWLPLAGDSQARFRVPTLRNVDKRPYPTFVKAYGHNGYFKSLKSIVHFY